MQGNEADTSIRRRVGKIPELCGPPDLESIEVQVLIACFRLNDSSRRTRESRREPRSRKVHGFHFGRIDALAQLIG
jgi:hypothetical protein